jgi:hypothetical protein
MEEGMSLSPSSRQARLLLRREACHMAKKLKNHGKSWSPEDLEVLRQLVKENTSGPAIGLRLGRTEDAIYAKAAEENISLRRTRRRILNRQK